LQVSRCVFINVTVIIIVIVSIIIATTTCYHNANKAVILFIFTLFIPRLCFCIVEKCRHFRTGGTS
jgi:hypothetical protein